MADLIENKFSIRRIRKATEDDYIAALRIYNETTPVDIKTNTNELTYWLSKKDDNCPFEVMLFALYLDNTIVGFSMLSFIKTQRIVVIEYIALYGHYRINTVFFPYFSLLQNYVLLAGYDIAYYVVEISNKGKGLSIDKESQFFKKLICIEGFSMINAPYQTLPLGLKNHESSFEANLFIKTSDNLKHIAKSTFLDIVHAIYFEYSLLWYKEFLDADDFSIYRQKAEMCFESVKKHIPNSESLDIQHTDCPLVSHPDDEKTFGLLPTKKVSKVGVYPIIFIVLLASPILIIWGYNSILQLLNIQLSSVSSMIGGVIGAMISAVTAFFVSKRKS